MNPKAKTEFHVILSTPTDTLTAVVILTHESTMYNLLAVACEIHNITTYDILSYSIVGHTWEREE